MSVSFPALPNSQPPEGPSGQVASAGNGSQNATGQNANAKKTLTAAQKQQRRNRETLPLLQQIQSLEKRLDKLKADYEKVSQTTGPKNEGITQTQRLQGLQQAMGNTVTRIRGLTEMVTRLSPGHPQAVSEALNQGVFSSSSQSALPAAPLDVEA